MIQLLYRSLLHFNALHLFDINLFYTLSILLTSNIRCIEALMFFYNVNPYKNVEVVLP